MVTPDVSLPLIVVTGPTACGKTLKAVALAKAMNGEIVSADSRQLYRGMDLGTGKDLEEYGNVPVHLIDICPVGYRYNLYEYLRDSRQAIADITARGKQPILCGGTGLYVESVVRGVYLPEVGENPELRARLADKSLEELTEILNSMRPLHNTTDTDSRQRAIRAIEIETGYRNHPETLISQPEYEPLQPVVIGLDISRDERRQRIHARLISRLERGMVQEVRNLLNEGVPAENLIYYGLEYKFLTLYVTGKIGYEQMVEELYTAICQFAKRQMTWFRGMERRGTHINWLPYNLSDQEFVNQTINIISSSKIKS